MALGNIQVLVLFIFFILLVNFLSIWYQKCFFFLQVIFLQRMWVYDIVINIFVWGGSYFIHNRVISCASFHGCVMNFYLYSVLLVICYHPWTDHLREEGQGWVKVFQKAVQAVLQGRLLSWVHFWQQHWSRLFQVPT